MSTPSATRILLVEDDTNLGFVIQDTLRMQGYKVHLCPDGKEGLMQFNKEKYDLCLLDVMMPKKDGFELAKDIRKIDPDVPIVFLTAKGMQEDKVEGFLSGADDYITGPIDRTMVLDRVMALQMGGAQPRVNERLELGALLVDLAALQARWNGRALDLRPNEFRLLHFLAQNPDRVLSRGDLIAALGKQEPPIDERTVDVWVGRLRRALRKVGAGERVRTVRSLGYVYDSYD